MNFEEKRRRAIGQLRRHVKHVLYCEECDRSYSIRYMDRHHRAYKHQHNLLILENVPRIHPSGVNDVLNSQSKRIHCLTNSIGIIQEVCLNTLKEMWL